MRFRKGRRGGSPGTIPIHLNLCLVNHLICYQRNCRHRRKICFFPAKSFLDSQRFHHLIQLNPERKLKLRHLRMKNNMPLLIHQTREIH